MRKRFRGNKPLGVTQEVDEAQSSRQQQQLYAGKPAFESVKEISGDEVKMDPEKTRGLQDGDEAVCMCAIRVLFDVFVKDRPGMDWSFCFGWVDGIMEMDVRYWV